MVPFKEGQWLFPRNWVMRGLFSHSRSSHFSSYLCKTKHLFSLSFSFMSRLGSLENPFLFLLFCCGVYTRQKRLLPLFLSLSLSFFYPTMKTKGKKMPPRPKRGNTQRKGKKKKMGSSSSFSSHTKCEGKYISKVLYACVHLFGKNVPVVGK